MKNSNGFVGLVRGKYDIFVRMCEALPFAIALLFARFAGAIDFWRSGQKKIDGNGIGLDFWNGADAAYRFEFNVFDVKETTFALFEGRYGIHKSIAPFMTYAATIGEFILPLLLVFGFGTRFAALGLLGMTAFIQFWVFPADLLSPNGSWIKHLLWTAPLLVVLMKGPGTFSLDYYLGRDRAAT